MHGQGSKALASLVESRLRLLGARTDSPSPLATLLAAGGSGARTGEVIGQSSSLPFGALWSALELGAGLASGTVIFCSGRVVTELPQLSTVGILGRCSSDKPLVDLSTNRVAE